MIYPTNIFVNGEVCGKENIVAGTDLRFSWILHGEGRQQAYSLKLLQGQKTVWDSGWVASDGQSCKTEIPVLRSGRRYAVILTVRDEDGKETALEGCFRVALLEAWPASWIVPETDLGEQTVCFVRTFETGEDVPENAVLFVCGIGYHRVTLNGGAVSDHRMAPAVSGYDKRCYYEVLDLKPHLQPGENTLCVEVGQGWRRNEGPYIGHMGERKVTFFGRPQLTAMLSAEWGDGSALTVMTDESWLWHGGNTVYSNLFDGETYDARLTPGEMRPCVVTDAPGESCVLMPQELAPIRVQQAITPVSVHRVGDGWVFDLGRNIAGVAEIRIPEGLPEGTVITLRHSEILDEQGDLCVAPLRKAKATDRYIVGKENLQAWSPSFLYHGFRYVKVSGLPFAPMKDFLRGLHMYTDVDNGSFFRCGSGIANRIYDMILLTERDNIHSIATDCPQRDERMGWMNDATVRFEGMPYHFRMARFFPKILRDICDTQEDGAITCTAPYLYGNRPADPVSSSFLIAAQMCWLHYGDIDTLREVYPALRAWNDCLARYSTDGIVELSYYGDWASPRDCCAGSVRSALTPGEFMSTGFHYYNCTLLASFAEALGLEEEAKAHSVRADFVREAFLRKWLHEDGTVCTGSQGCQALALRIGILPKETRSLAAEKMHEAVLRAGTRLTTGNLCTMYLMEMLTEYGYVDTAWALFTREEYPSWGYMLQNGATTVWERFELEKGASMNSHCHPMYGSVGKWLYSHIAGITPAVPGFRKARICPHIPAKLLTGQAVVDTCRGEILFRWEREEGTLRILVTIPCGMEAEICFAGSTVTVGAGTYSFTEGEKTECSKK